MERIRANMTKVVAFYWASSDMLSINLISCYTPTVKPIPSRTSEALPGTSSVCLFPPCSYLLLSSMSPHSHLHHPPSTLASFVSLEHVDKLPLALGLWSSVLPLRTFFTLTITWRHLSTLQFQLATLPNFLNMYHYLSSWWGQCVHWFYILEGYLCQHSTAGR